MTEPTSDKKGPSLTRQTTVGVLWMVLFKMAVRCLSIISTLVLVRLLTPEDFGLVAMAIVFFAVLDQLTMFNFDLVLIVNQKTTRAHFDTAFTCNVLFKTAAAIVLSALAYPASLYFNEPRVIPLILILAGVQFASGFTNIGIVNFRKRMEFNKEFNYMFFSKFAGFMVTMPMVFFVRNYWAMIAGQVATGLARVILSYAMDRFRPRFALTEWRSLLNFSKWAFLSNLLSAIRLRATELIVGRVSGAEKLGLFNISYELSNTPTTELIQPINRAVFPAYAKISDDLASLRHGYLRVLGMIALITLPAALGIAATAPLIVPVALGDAWLATIPLFIVLGFTGAIAGLQFNIQSVYFALGRPKMFTLIQFINTLAVIGCIIPGALYADIEGAALGFFAATVLLTPWTFSLVLRDLKLDWLSFFAHLWRPVVGSLAMYLATAWFTLAVIDHQNGLATLPGLIIAIAFGAVVYTLVVPILWWLSGRPAGSEQYLLDLVSARLTRRRA